jgi:hypothetical protein
MNLGYRRMEAAIAASIACLAFAIPAAACAATAKYPPDAAARGFNGGLAGWTSTAGFEGSCLPPVLCPSATNSFQASGGADGGGFIRSAYQGVVGVMAIGGTSTSVYTSPQFVYRGADGEAADMVGFGMDRRANVDELLAVSGNAATYSVRLIDDTAGGETISVIALTTLAGANSWLGTQATVDPDRLVQGHAYRIAIESTYVTGTSTLVSGSADYDNVALSASTGADSTGEDGRRRSGGRNGDGSGSGLTPQRLSALFGNALPATAVVKGTGKQLLVRVKCPRKVGRSCRIAAQGMLTKRKAATNQRSVKVRRGKAKLVKLRVKPKARKEVRKRKRLLVRHRVRAGKVSTTVFKKRKLIRR